MGNGFATFASRLVDREAHGVRELVRDAVAQAERPEGKLGKPCIVYARLNPPRQGLTRADDEPDTLNYRTTRYPEFPVLG